MVFFITIFFIIFSTFLLKFPFFSTDRNQARVGVYVGGSALDRNTDLLTEILGDILTKPDFSNTEHTNSLLFQVVGGGRKNEKVEFFSYFLSTKQNRNTAKWKKIWSAQVILMPFLGLAPTLTTLRSWKNNGVVSLISDCWLSW